MAVKDIRMLFINGRVNFNYATGKPVIDLPTV